MTATTDTADLLRERISRFPSTRYQGSKRKLAHSILAQLDDLEYTTVLDAFGGTGVVSYAFKASGKSVTYNDILAFNHQIGLALIENSATRLDDDTIAGVGNARSDVDYDDMIERTFQGIYFTDAENRWLDVAVGNIRRIRGKYKRALAWFALFQAAMIKRPYNLFHRANLYMRTADVTRSFGNKATWDKGFAEHFQVFARQANEAVVEGAGACRAMCADALDIEPQHDLVYIDTPYINHAGIGVDYRDFYHFLEGMVLPGPWSDAIDLASKHRRLRPIKNPWNDPRACRDQFARLFERFRDSILVVSYRSDGVPPIAELVDMLRRVKARVSVVDGARYQYVLSTKRTSREVILIAEG